VLAARVAARRLHLERGRLRDGGNGPSGGSHALPG
jgi:hypothetical protein